MPVDERLATLPRGGILYDASRVRKPEEVFSLDHWRALGGLEELAGGRGLVSILRSGDQRWVLRHYRRGGWAARVSSDRYLWLGAARTRSFMEWRLLKRLLELGLPVPAPIAARYIRHSLTYQADLITEHLGATRTLADSITGAALDREHWAMIGGTLAAFHAHGVQHADLNANNILLAQDEQAASAVYLLDFDRGRIRERGAWEQAVLARLRRSLEKIRRLQLNVAFGDEQWSWLMAGYEQHLAEPRHSVAPSGRS
jgi:3-deoxy-D-manno-octulosonic acid kinase